MNNKEVVERKMKKISYALFSLVIFFGSLYAQETRNVSYGKASMEELAMPYCNIDSTAGAIVLFEKGDVELEFDALGIMKMVNHYYVRYKIFKKSGLNKSVITIPYIQGGYAEDELITNLGGYTYNLIKGRVSSIGLIDTCIRDEQIDGIHYQKVIKMPNVKEGSVFEIRYTLERIFTGKAHNPDPWVFQKDIPVLWSEFNTTFPSNIKYRILKSGLLVITETELNTGLVSGWDKHAKVHRFLVKDALPFYNESYLNSREDYISKVDYELVSITLPTDFWYTHLIPKIDYTETWEQAHQLISSTGQFGENLGRNGLLKDAITSIELVKDTMERIKRAFEYVSKNIKWNNKMALLEEDDPQVIAKNKQGSATEINLILISLLKHLNLNAKPVIISTRGNGKITSDFPILRQFNYTITSVTVYGKELLMDATDPLTKPGMLPLRCLNDKGVILEGKDSRPISIAPIEKDFQLQMMNVKLSEDASEARGDMEISKEGYNAYNARTDLFNGGEEAFFRNISRRAEELEFKNLKIKNKEKVYEPLIITGNFKFSCNSNSGGIKFNPMFSGRVNENPFIEGYRVYPLDLAYGKDEFFIATIRIPDAYEIIEIPKPALVNLPEGVGKFIYLITSVGNTIHLSSRIVLNEFYFPASEYEMLTNFYDEIIKKHSQLITIRKK